MTDQEIIYKAIREVVNTDNPAEFAAHNSTCYTIAKYVCEELREKLNSLPAEQPSEEFKGEFDDYLVHGDIRNPNFDGPFGYDDIRKTAIHFANWQKEQMMKSAIDAVIVNDETSGCVVDCEQGCLVLEPHRYPIGQQLKILIIKEDKQ